MELIISCPDLKEAAFAVKGAASIIADAIMRRSTTTDPAPAEIQAPAVTEAAPATQAAPVTAPVAQAARATAPVTTVAQTAPATPAAAPVEAPSYSIQDLMAAGAALIRGDPTETMRAKLGALLQQYGVKAVTDLTAEQLPTFAAALKGLGAKL